jgi:hypothetical protein
MRRHDELAAGTVLLPVSRSPAGPPAHRRMRQGGQRCTKRCFRTRPWVPSSGWLEGVLPTASRPLNWSVKSFCDCPRQVPGTAAPPHERGKRRRSGPGRGREGNPGGRAGSRSRATDRPSIRTRTDNTTRSPACTSTQRPRLCPVCPEIRTRRGCATRDAVWVAPHWGVRHGWPLGRARMRRPGPVRDGDG